MTRKFKSGALYSIKSKRPNSTFRMMIRFCVYLLDGVGQANPVLYLQDLLTGELELVKNPYTRAPDGLYEFEDEWDDFEVELVSNDIKSFITCAGNRIHDLT